MEGNQMKMREAVEAALSELDKFGQVHDARIHFADIVHIGRARGMLQAALSAPPRQCDVGTAEEQEVRFKRFCGSYWNLNNTDSECAGCPLNEMVGTECEFEWAQMPYAEEGAGE